MGSVFRQKGRNRQTWMMKYYVNGRPIVESSGTTSKMKAQRLCDELETDLRRGLPLTPDVGKIRLDDAAQDFDVIPSPPIDKAPQVAYEWTVDELSEAFEQLPEGIFAGHYFDRIAERVAGEPHVGLSLLHRLQDDGRIASFGVRDDGMPDPRGPFLRFQKVRR